MATYESTKAKYFRPTDAIDLGVGENADQIAYLAFKIATQEGLTVFNMADGVSDEYEDETGIDTSASQNETYDSSNDLYSVTGSVNLTLISTASTASSAPDHGRLVIFEEKVDGTVDINTDIKGFISRDNGTTYTELTMALESTYESGKRIFAGSADISAQPSGTSMRYKVRGYNNKDFKIHGASMTWK